jgi:hypothetical protein
MISLATKSISRVARQRYRFGALVLLGGAVPAAGQPSTWIGPAAGDWGVASNWNNGIPNAPTASATVDARPAQFSTASINAGAVALGGLTIGTGDTVSVAGGATLQLGGGTLANGGTLLLSAGTDPAVLSLTGTLTLSGVGRWRLMPSATSVPQVRPSPGVLLTNNQFISGGGMFGGGSGRLVNNGTITADNSAFPLVIAPGAPAAFLNSFLNLGTLSAAGGHLVLDGPAVGTATYGSGHVVTSGSGSVTVSRRAFAGDMNTLLNQGTFTVDGGYFDVYDVVGQGLIDLRNGAFFSLISGSTGRAGAIRIDADSSLFIADFVIDYTGPTTPITDYREMIRRGYGTGNWNGTSGIRLGQGSPFAFGYAEASTVLGLSGSATATFGGQPVDATSILIRRSRFGDATLDGTVGIGDFALLAANFNSPGTIWSTGDFDYDGTTGIGDFALLAANFNRSMLLGLPRESIVPEPGLAVLAVVPLAAARRRHPVRAET